MIWESGQRVETLLRQKAGLWDRRLERDLLVLAPDWRQAGSILSRPFRCVLLPGEAQLKEGTFPGRWVVSYGMSPRDSLTFSSVGEHRSVLALQRELMTLEGRVLERQELLLDAGRQEAEPSVLLAAAGTLLLLGAGTGSLRNWPSGPLS